jgi:diamine N-acetyltransferase
MGEIMLEGQFVRLRPWREDDLLTLCALRNDIRLQAQLLARPRGSTTDQVRQWLVGFENDPQSIFLVISKLVDDQSVGFVQVKQIDTLNRRAEFGIALAAEYVGHGFGLEAITALQSYLRKNWNLRKLMLQVRSDNTRAQDAYQKSGFKTCGVFEKHVFIDGSWHDVVNMEMFL